MDRIAIVIMDSYMIGYLVIENLTWISIASTDIYMDIRKSHEGIYGYPHGFFDLWNLSMYQESYDVKP